MKKSIKTLIQKLKENPEGKIEGGFIGIKGGAALKFMDKSTNAPNPMICTNTTGCSNSTACEGSNQTEACTNSGDCSDADNTYTCTNSGRCLF